MRAWRQWLWTGSLGATAVVVLLWQERRSPPSLATNAHAAPLLVAGHPPLPVAAPAPATDPRTALISGVELARGWQLQEGPRLVSPARLGADKRGQAQVTFRRGALSAEELLSEDLLVFAPGEARAYFTSSRQVLHVGERGFPPFGDESFVTQSQAVMHGRNYQTFTVWVRDGERVLILTYQRPTTFDDSSAESWSLLEPVVRVALTRLAVIEDTSEWRPGTQPPRSAG